MGFPKKMVEKLFENPEQDINDPNHAVELLIEQPKGWVHKPFDDGEGIC